MRKEVRNYEEGIKYKEGRQDVRKEGRNERSLSNEGRKEGRKEGSMRKEGWKCEEASK